MGIKDIPKSHNDIVKPSGAVKDSTFGTVVARFKYPSHAVLYADMLNRACNRQNKYVAFESDIEVR